MLRDLGFTYSLDWCCDDQPFPLTVPGLISVPYSLDINDISMWMNQTVTGAEYERIVLDQFEVLLSEAQTKGSARVMALPLHTFVVGQPFRLKYLARFFARSVRIPMFGCVQAMTSPPITWRRRRRSPEHTAWNVEGLNYQNIIGEAPQADLGVMAIRVLSSGSLVRQPERGNREERIARSRQPDPARTPRQ